MPVDIVEPPAAYVSSTSLTSIAIGVNNPLSWGGDGPFALGVSVGVGLGTHLVLRGNVAWYDKTRSELDAITNVVLHGDDGDGGRREGGVTAVGASAMYFKRRAWDGLLLDGGIVIKHEDHIVYDDFASVEFVHQQTIAAGLRGQIGWSWRIGPVFAALAVGLSTNYVRGQETVGSVDYVDSPRMTLPVSRLEVEPEGMFRLGGVFDL